MIEIKDIDPNDYIDEIIEFSSVGMNLSIPSASKTHNHLFQFSTAAEVIGHSNIFLGAFEDGEFLGFLFADDYGDKTIDVSFYAKAFNLLKECGPANSFMKEYDKINEKLYSDLQTKPDAELTFFACKPGVTGKGIGSGLMKAMQERLSGKLVFLYTDDGCTYQFYEHRGFRREGQKTLNFEIKGENNSLECMIFTKQF